MKPKTLIYLVVGVLVVTQVAKRLVVDLMADKMVEAIGSDDPKVEAAARAGAQACGKELGGGDLVRLAAARLSAAPAQCPPGCRPV